MLPIELMQFCDDNFGSWGEKCKDCQLINICKVRNITDKPGDWEKRMVEAYEALNKSDGA